ncbi:glutamate-5-semialdehyde dehydrogenase [Bacillota bacterium]
MSSTDNIKEMTASVKSDSYKMAALPLARRNDALSRIAALLQTRSLEIFAANAKDIERAQAEKLPDPLIKRLRFDSTKLRECLDGIEGLIGLADPLFNTVFKRELDEDLILHKVTCPIGVIGVVFESRPDALIQIATLCLKSGNCVILKGGSEAAETNKALYDVLSQACNEGGIPRGFLTLIENRADIGSLLKCHEDIDLLIPRGSNAFVQYIMENTKIPVMGHADGICHIYVDENFDIDIALPVIADAKTQYPAVCNAVETLLVHEAAAERLIPPLVEALRAKGVIIRGSRQVQKIAACDPAGDEDWESEYLDYVLSVKTVTDLDEAISHINRYGSHHTDCIISENPEAVEKFMLFVDSAGVYQNCSTRFADGYRYGFGAEVGVSTGKLHARGPVGLDGLVTYKYRLYGHGNKVGDYASGLRKFNFKDL